MDTYEIRSELENGSISLSVSIDSTPESKSELDDLFNECQRSAKFILEAIKNRSIINYNLVPDYGIRVLDED